MFGPKARTGVAPQQVLQHQQYYQYPKNARGSETPMARTTIVGQKVGMTQLWDDQNNVVPVTVVKVSPARVVQVKTPDRDGYSAIQVTYGSVKTSRLSKPELGHFAAAGVTPGTELLEFRVDDAGAWSIGQEISADVFSVGDFVDVTAVSRGKGFAGVIKRHNFHGMSASHGVHRTHRAPGSIGGCSTPARVFKGMKMAGRMGGEQVTTQNLRIVKADADQAVVLVRGAIPGAKGATVLIKAAAKKGAK
jgi:large subunit ribosomal protein L3